jgi:lactobin A/cerein 7B family class IIb bacteriocin
MNQMRTLTNEELAQVEGGGFWADLAGALIEAAVGAIINFFFPGYFRPY